MPRFRRNRKKETKEREKKKTNIINSGQDAVTKSVKSVHAKRSFVVQLRRVRNEAKEQTEG